MTLSQNDLLSILETKETLGERRRVLSETQINSDSLKTGNDYAMHIYAEYLVARREWNTLFTTTFASEVPAIQHEVKRLLSIPRVQSALLSTFAPSSFSEQFCSAGAIVRSGIISALKSSAPRSRDFVAAVWPRLTSAERTKLINVHPEFFSVIFNSKVSKQYLDYQHLTAHDAQALFAAIIKEIAKKTPIDDVNEILISFNKFILQCVSQKSLSSLTADFISALSKSGHGNHVVSGFQASSSSNYKLFKELFFFNPDLFVSTFITDCSDSAFSSVMNKGFSSVIVRVVEQQNRLILIKRLAAFVITFNHSTYRAPAKDDGCSYWDFSYLVEPFVSKLGLSKDEVEILYENVAAELEALGWPSIVRHSLFSSFTTPLFRPNFPLPLLLTICRILISALEKELDLYKVLNFGNRAVIWALIHFYRKTLTTPSEFSQSKIMDNHSYLHDSDLSNRQTGLTCYFAAAVAFKSVPFVVEAFDVLVKKYANSSDMCQSLLLIISRALLASYLWTDAASEDLCSSLISFFTHCTNISELVRTVCDAAKNVLSSILTISDDIVFPPFFSSFLKSLVDYAISSGASWNFYRINLNFVHDEIPRLIHSKYKKKHFYPASLVQIPVKHHPEVTSFVINYCASSNMNPLPPIAESWTPPIKNARFPATPSGYGALAQTIINQLNLKFSVPDKKRRLEILHENQNNITVSGHEDEAPDAPVVYRLSTNLLSKLRGIPTQLNHVLAKPDELPVIKDEEKGKVETIVPRRSPPFKVNSQGNSKYFTLLPARDSAALVAETMEHLKAKYNSATTSTTGALKTKLRLVKATLQSKALAFPPSAVDYISSFLRGMFLLISVNPQKLNEAAVRKTVRAVRPRKRAAPVRKLNGKKAAKASRYPPQGPTLSALNSIVQLLQITPNFHIDSEFFGLYDDGIEKVKIANKSRHKNAVVQIPAPTDAAYPQFVLSNESGYGLLYLMESQYGRKSKVFRTVSPLLSRFFATHVPSQQLMSRLMVIPEMSHSLNAAINLAIRKLPAVPCQTRTIINNFVASLLELALPVTPLKGVLTHLPHLPAPGESAAKLLEVVTKRPKLNRDARALLVRLSLQVMLALPLNTPDETSVHLSEKKTVLNILSAAAKLADQGPIAHALLDCIRESPANIVNDVAFAVSKMVEKVELAQISETEQVLFSVRSPKVALAISSHSLARISNYKINARPDLTATIYSLLLACEQKDIISNITSSVNGLMSTSLGLLDSLSSQEMSSFSIDELFIKLVRGIYQGFADKLACAPAVASALVALFSELSTKRAKYFIDYQRPIFLLSHTQGLDFSTPEQAIQWLVGLIKGSTNEDDVLLAIDCLSDSKKAIIPGNYLLEAMKSKSRTELSTLAHSNPVIWHVLDELKVRVSLADMHEVLSLSDLSPAVRRAVTDSFILLVKLEGRDSSVARSRR
ncbi:hypothetical protein RCL1_003708 [Eukaryota sp. TZLM3-RCL]